MEVNVQLINQDTYRTHIPSMSEFILAHGVSCYLQVLAHTIRPILFMVVSDASTKLSVFPVHYAFAPSEQLKQDFQDHIVSMADEAKCQRQDQRPGIL